MRKSILPLFTATLLIMSLSSCDKEDQAVKSDTLFPINTGNSWTYKYTYFNRDEGDVDTTFMTVGNKVTINGYTGYAIADGRPFNARFVAGNDEYGNYVNYGGYSDVDTLVTTPSIEFKKDAKLGDEWDYSMVCMDWDSGKFSDMTVPIKCISVDTLITTPKGDFRCMGFEASIYSGMHIFRYYLSMNVGLVKSEHYEGDYLFSYSELIHYVIN